MFERLSRSKKVCNPFKNIASIVEASQEVVNLQEVSDEGVAQNRLALFIEHLTTAELDAFDSACKTYGNRTVRQFILNSNINANVINTLVDVDNQDDLVLLTLATLRAQFAIYSVNLDAT